MSGEKAVWLAGGREGERERGREGERERGRKREKDKKRRQAQHTYREGAGDRFQQLWAAHRSQHRPRSRQQPFCP